MRVRAAVATLALLGALCAAPAGANFEDGDSLYAKCTGSDVEKTMCATYLKAIADVVGAFEWNGYKACFSSDLTVREMVDVVTRFLAERPDLRHYSASSLVALIFSQAAPCP